MVMPMIMTHDEEEQQLPRRIKKITQQRERSEKATNPHQGGDVNNIHARVSTKKKSKRRHRSQEEDRKRT